MATVIQTDGRLREVAPANGVEFTLAELQTVVGGYIEAVRNFDGRFMFLNEEGKLHGLPVNIIATHLARVSWSIRPDDVIVGDVIICTMAEAGQGGATSA